MSTYTWPNSKPYWPAQAAWRQLAIQRHNTSPLSGYTQTLGMPGTRWALRLAMPAQSYAERHALGALIKKLEGRRHWLAMWCPIAPKPAGTCNLAGVTLSASASQFAETLTLTGCGAGKTLLADDWLVVAGQRLAVVDDAVANGSGVMTVATRHQLRAAATAGTAVGLDAPTTTMALHYQGDDPPEVPFDGRGQAPAFTIELVEVWA